MVETDWERILSANPSSLTDEEIEDLCPEVIRCDVDEITDIHNLRTLMKLSQEMLQYKDNQVESLLLECGELKQTISSLKPEADKRKRKEWDVSEKTTEIATPSKRTDLPENGNVQGKNKKIKILMTELESLEKENVVLKEQLTTLTHEMEDATAKMNEMTEEVTTSRVKSIEYKERISYLERENSAFLSQIEELTAQQIDRDKVIDEFGTAIELRINEWKGILDEKDAEITQLKENLSQSLMQTVTSAKEENRSEIIYLNGEIDRRDKVIVELQKKLSEAVVEINESATLIEKLKADAQKVGKSDKRKEQKELLKKLQDANKKVGDLQNELQQAEEDIKSKSSKLCEVLSTLRKYESENQGLTEALNDIRELRNELGNKNEHIKDLINVVNKLEMLNSYQEMEIITLREKLGIPEDETVSIQHTLAKRKQGTKKVEELMQQNKNLIEENLELKSDIRTLKYQLNKLQKESNFSNNTVDGTTELNSNLHSTKLPESETRPLYPSADMIELKNNIQMVIEENEALRTGMHEILDSIRNQDGKSAVEIQSSTLERLLEALDVRHLAGWYHPAMRLQEHLNVVQGSNAELRSQLKQLRRELQQKDIALQNLILNRSTDSDKFRIEESENEKVMMYLAELKSLREAYQNETEEWEKQKESLNRENDELKIEVDKLKLQVEIYEENLKVFEEGEDEVQKTLAIKTKEYASASGESLIVNRKNAALRELLNKETEKAYQYQKEAIRNENNLRKELANSSKHNKVLECELSTLQSNLTNSVSKVTHTELQEKYEELSIRFRDVMENNTILNDGNKVQSLKDEIEVLKQQKQQLVEQLQKKVEYENDEDLTEQLGKLKAQELVERQRADHMAKLYETSQGELLKAQDNIKEILAAKSELQEELAAVHSKLTRETRLNLIDTVDENKLQELRDNNAKLKIEKENLERLLQVSQEEAQLQYSLNSLKTLELDSLRHQILNLQAVSEDKATISRLDFELTSRKMSEIELNAQKVRLENEVSYLQEQLEKSQKTAEGLRTYVQDCRKQCENRCRTYVDIIAFLQNQYAGSTSISSLEKILLLSEKLKKERQTMDDEIKRAKEYHEGAKLQQELLNTRLQIVESLKDILEQQIGSNSVHDIMQRFSEYSQHTLSDFKFKRRIAQLEYELQIANNKFIEYESIITNMEHDMIQIQKAWGKGQESRSKSVVESPETKRPIVETRSIEVQTDPYTCCLESEKEEEEKSVHEDEHKSDDNKDNTVFLQDQLSQALKLASERSATLIKYESQIAEYQAKIEALNKALENKNFQQTEKEKIPEEYKIQLDTASSDGSDKLALKSTINSLQKLITQKEETIARYQNLLKEDRDEHSKAAGRLQEEIKRLHDRIQAMQIEAEKSQQRNDDVSKEASKSATSKTEESVSKTDLKSAVMHEEETARLRETISTLEADLNITKELSERWHRLAEERLKHMDRMRERLEEQHKNELESYRGELNKWQSEADALRKQLSENRMLLTKVNISLMKELQERDDKISELTFTCQQLQSELEFAETSNRTQPVNEVREAKMQEVTQNVNRDNVQQQSQLDSVRKQLQSFMEKEKAYKQEIADLKQQLSRRYMAVKTQEKKASQREVQLERKVKALEEELHKARIQLDREYLVQEAKKAKTAEELSLWEKQKKWQQTAEKLKEKLKEKSDEYTKLLANYEKLRSVVGCMEREKWYLKSKLKIENNTVAGNLSARPISTAQQSTMEDLQKECQILRSRIKELTDRLDNEDNKQLLLKLDEQKRRIAAFEIASQGNNYVISQLEKLEMTKDILEKMNLKLEAENFELRLELEKAISDTPRLREKVEHLEKYIELLKVEKSSDSSPRSMDKDVQERGVKKSTMEMERTIFTLKRIVERLQVENKRLRITSKKNHLLSHQGKSLYCEPESVLQRQYEEAQKRVIALETDLQLAEQRIAMLEKALKEDNNGEVGILKQQLIHKSELLDKVKHLLTRAAINEKTLRQRVQQLESKHTLSTIPECYVTPATPE